MANSPISREGMPEVNIPAVLNGTPNGLAVHALAPDRRSTHVACSSGQLRFAIPGTLAVGDVVNERGDNDVVGERAKDRTAAEAARREAEQFRRLAEEAREVRDHHREALET